MRILVINGPNLNMLGRRDAGIYGTITLEEINQNIRTEALAIDVEVEFFQSNHEGAIIDFLQESATRAAGIIINGGALTHYGLSMRDALVDTSLPIVEIHLSNIHAREDFRHNSVIAPIAIGQIAGLGEQGYINGLRLLLGHIQEGK